MTDITKDEVINLMAEAARKPPLTGKGSGAYVRRQVERALDALSAAGFAIVPYGATEAMQSAACSNFNKIAGLNAAIDAGNLLKE